MSARVIELLQPSEHPRAVHRSFRRGCDPIAWYVLEALAEYAGKDDVARVSIGRVATANALSHATVKRAIRELVSIGYLERGAPDGRLIPWVLRVDPLEVTQARTAPAQPRSPVTRVSRDLGHPRPVRGVTGDPAEGSRVTPQVGSSEVGSREVALTAGAPHPVPAPPSKIRKSRKASAGKVHSPAARLLGQEFRIAFLENHDAEHGFAPDLSPADLDACERLLARYAPERLTAAIQFATRDKADPPRWCGWPARVQSVKALEDHFARIDQQARNATKRPGAAAPELSKHDEAIFRRTTFNEWQASVKRCSVELRQRGAEPPEGFGLAARRMASKTRGYGWEMDPPPAADGPGAYPWKAWP